MMSEIIEEKDLMNKRHFIIKSREMNSLKNFLKDEINMVIELCYNDKKNEIDNNKKDSIIRDMINCEIIDLKTLYDTIKRIISEELGDFDYFETNTNASEDYVVFKRLVELE